MNRTTLAALAFSVLSFLPAGAEELCGDAQCPWSEPAYAVSLDRAHEFTSELKDARARAALCARDALTPTQAAVCHPEFVGSPGQFGGQGGSD